MDLVANEHFSKITLEKYYSLTLVLMSLSVFVSSVTSGSDVYFSFFINNLKQDTFLGRISTMPIRIKAETNHFFTEGKYHLKVEAGLIGLLFISFLVLYWVMPRVSSFLIKHLKI